MDTESIMDRHLMELRQPSVWVLKNMTVDNHKQNAFLAVFQSRKTVKGAYNSIDILY